MKRLHLEHSLSSGVSTKKTNGSAKQLPKYSLVLRRHDYFKLEQGMESTTAFMLKKRELRDHAELEKMTADDIHFHTVLKDLSDQELIKKLLETAQERSQLKQHPLTMEEIDEICQQSEIKQLPVEMLLNIFENLSLHDLVVKGSKTCLQWREIITQFMLRPKILRLANVNGAFKKNIEKDGWTEECDDTELILSLYQKYEIYSSKYFGTFCLFNQNILHNNIIILNT